jgi:hypothetical protein
MFPSSLLAATAAFMAPVAPLDGQLNAAIWNDLQANAMIGNGDRLAALWANAGNEKPLTLHIEQLRCGQQKAVLQCSFTLARDGGQVTVFGEDSPEHLRCVASFEKSADMWHVIHQPPKKRRGHSQSSMNCQRLKS